MTDLLCVNCGKELCNEAEPIEYGTKDPFLQEIAGELRIMFASAIHHGEDHVTGYTIKTGAIHRIVGLLSAAGYPVQMPNPRPPTILGLNNPATPTELKA